MVMYNRRRSRPMQAVASKASVSKQLATLKRKVNQLNPETKTFQAATSFTNVDDAVGQIVYLSGITIGADVNTRLGEKISVKNISVRFKITSGNSATITNASLYGVYLICDNQSSGVVPVVSGSSQSIFVNPGPLQSDVNVYTKDRFKILRRWIYSAGMLAGGNQSVMQTFNVKRNHPSQYHDGTAAQSGAGKNSYYLVCMTDDTADTIDLAIWTQILYTDM